MSEWRHGVCNNIDFSTQQNIWTFIYCLSQWFSNILHNRHNLHICTLASLPSELPLAVLLTVLLVKQHHLHIYKYFFIIFPSLPCPTFSHSLTHNPTVSCILWHSFELSWRPYNVKLPAFYKDSLFFFLYFVFSFDQMDLPVIRDLSEDKSGLSESWLVNKY